MTRHGIKFFLFDHPEIKRVLVSGRNFPCSVVMKGNQMSVQTCCAQCYSAKKEDCKCSCHGENHQKNPSDLYLEEVKERLSGSFDYGFDYFDEAIMERPYAAISQFGNYRWNKFYYLNLMAHQLLGSFDNLPESEKAKVYQKLNTRGAPVRATKKWIAEIQDLERRPYLFTRMRWKKDGIDKTVVDAVGYWERLLGFKVSKECSHNLAESPHREYEKRIIVEMLPFFVEEVFPLILKFICRTRKEDLARAVEILTAQYGKESVTV